MDEVTKALKAAHQRPKALQKDGGLAPLEKWPDKDGQDDHGRGGGTGGGGKDLTTRTGGYFGGGKEDLGSGGGNVTSAETAGSKAAAAAGNKYGEKGNAAMNAREGGPIKAGERVSIRAEHADEGDQNYTFRATDDEEKGRVTIASNALGSKSLFRPSQVVDSHMIERHPAAEQENKLTAAGYKPSHETVDNATGQHNLTFEHPDGRSAVVSTNDGKVSTEHYDHEGTPSKEMPAARASSSASASHAGNHGATAQARVTSPKSSGSSGGKDKGFVAQPAFDRSKNPTGTVPKTRSRKADGTEDVEKADSAGQEASSAETHAGAHEPGQNAPAQNQEANQVVQKSQGAAQEPLAKAGSANIFFQINKVDEEKRLVYGQAVAEVPDRSGEIFDYETSKPLFEAWSAEVQRDTAGKSYGNIRSMHSKVAAGKIAEPLNFDDDHKSINIAAKVVDDNEWEKVLEGVHTGFSIGGSYVKKWQDGDLTRYTAEPNEISLVDRPCVPTAKFFDVVKSDGTVHKVAFKEGSMTQETQAAAPAAKAVTVDELTDKMADILKAGGLSEAEMLEAIEKAHAAKAAPPAAKDDDAGDDGDVENAEKKAKDPNAQPPQADNVAANQPTGEQGKGGDNSDNKEQGKGGDNSTATGHGKGGDNSTNASQGTGDNGHAAASSKKADVPSRDVLVKLANRSLKKGLYSVGTMANILCSIQYLQCDTAWEAKYEADNSALPGQLRDWMAAGVDILAALVDEETREMMEQADKHVTDSAADEDDGIDTLLMADAAGTLGKGAALTLSVLRKVHRDGGDPKKLLARRDELGKAVAEKQRMGAALEKVSTEAADLRKQLAAGKADLEKAAKERDEAVKKAAELAEKIKAPAVMAVAKGADVVDDPSSVPHVPEVKDSFGKVDPVASALKMVHATGGRQAVSK